MYGRLEKDHQDVIKEHSSQLEELIITKASGLLDELEKREVITSAHKDYIMVGISGSYCFCYYFMYILIYILHSLQ